MGSTKDALDHAVRECWRANDRALSAVGCLGTALDEVRKALRENEDSGLVSVVKVIASAEALAELLAKRAETARVQLDDVIGKG